MDYQKVRDYAPNATQLMAMQLFLLGHLSHTDEPLVIYFHSLI